MGENKAKKVELTDDKLNEVSGGIRKPMPEEYLCAGCGHTFPSLAALEAHQETCISSYYNP